MSVELSFVTPLEEPTISFEEMEVGVLYQIMGSDYKPATSTLYTKSLQGTLVWFEKHGRVGTYATDSRRYRRAPSGTSVTIKN